LPWPWTGAAWWPEARCRIRHGTGADFEQANRLAREAAEGLLRRLSPQA
jgi:hypothetical protein